MPIHPIEKLSKYRKADTVVLLGSGSSIKRITPAQWKIIRDCDTLALNNWVYHPTFVPDFYMIECKHYDFQIVQRRLAQKREQYKDCRFIFPVKKKVRLKNRPPVWLREVVPWDASIFEYHAVLRDPKRRSKAVNANYKPHPRMLTKSYDASLTLALELLWVMGYKTIVLCGVDLKDSYYFWSGGEPEYGEVHHLTNKAHEGKDPHQPHATIIVKDFITDFSKRWMWNQGRKMYVGNPDTALYPEIPLIDWRTHDV